MEENNNKPQKEKKSKKKGVANFKKKHGSLAKCVKHSMEDYFAKLEGAETRDLYQMVMKEVEAPLLKVVMRETKQNQSTAALVLGLNRGTLRKKLKEHDLL